MLNAFNNILCALLYTKVLMGTYACRVFVMGLVAFGLVAAVLVWVKAMHHTNSYVAH